MSEMGNMPEMMKTEFVRPETGHFLKIKPKDGATFRESQDFWNNFFDKALVKSETESQKDSTEGDNDSSEQKDNEENVASDSKKQEPDEGRDSGNDSGKNNETQESNENKELSDDEINEKQKQAIKETFERIARGEKLTDAEKGNLGEMLMDQYYISRGYKPIHKPRVTDLEHKSGQGIDGVYEKENPGGTKSYVIADAKVNHSQLNKGLADGTDQMSDEWIDKRLDTSVGKEKADEIRDAYEDSPESVSREIYHFSYGDSEDGSSSADVSTVDENGNKNHDKVVVQVFDSEGNVVEGSGGDGNDEG